MKVRINEAACTGHGRCYALAPEVFQPDDQGLSVALFTEIPDELREQVRLAVSNCPEEALSIEEEN